MPKRTANLIDDRGVTVKLIREPLQWRVRVVEEVVVDTANSCARRRSLQVAPLRAFIGTHVPPSVSHALLALNVAPEPKGPLLDFDIEGPSGDAWLLPRIEIATRQAAYLEDLAQECGETLDARVGELLVHILAYTGEWFEGGGHAPLDEYLADGIGHTLPEDVLDRWLQIGEECKAILRPRLDIFRGYSAPENPALVMPSMLDERRIGELAEGTEVLQSYVDFLRRVNSQAARGSKAADELLVALADYANYYELIAAMRVPLDEPFLVKTRERRSLDMGRLSNRGEQELVIADALTNHVTFRVDDPNVRIAAFSAMEPASDHYAYGTFRARRDPQSRAFYAHDPDRDYRVRLVFKLSLLRRLQFVPYLVFALLLLLAAGLLTERATDLATLTLVVGPAALAASILSVREPSTLGSRLRAWSSIAVGTGLAILILVSTGLFVWGRTVGG